MSSKTFHFCAISKITLKREKGAAMSQLLTTDLRLEVSSNLDRSMYIDGKGLPRKDAMKPITNALLHGLITNVRHSATRGWMKEGEHMEYIINQLQRAFVANSDESISEMEY